MRTKRAILLIPALCSLLSSFAQPRPISPDIFGIFFEDLNYAADGGLYAELVQNRSFEYSPSDRARNGSLGADNWNPYTAWTLQRHNSIENLSIETAHPLNANNPHYLLLDVATPGTQGCGIANEGFDGMVLKKDLPYDFSVWLRNFSQSPGVKATVALRGKDGQTLAIDSLTLSSRDQWQKYSLTLRPEAAADSAQLVLLFHQPVRVGVDMVSLFPTDTFKGHKNGLRADLAQTIADIHPKFVRFPGGCLAHGDGLTNIYRWKRTIGPVEQRVAEPNIWRYSQTHGLGYHEFLQFCEDIGAKPLPVIAAGVSCQNSALCRGTGQEAIPMEEMPAFIQDILDLVEYCNGSADSEWGRRRAEAGHPQPFNLEYIGIGNEDHITPEFEERFAMIARALRDAYPQVKIVGTSGPDPSGEDFDKGWEAMRANDVEVVDEHYYRRPSWFLDNLTRYDGYDRRGPKVYVGEYASRANRLENALAEAAYMTQLERNGDVVEFASYAPLLARIGHTQWNPDLIYFDGKGVYPTVNYYVQQLFGQNSGEQYVDGVLPEGLRTASAVIDPSTGSLIIKMVNPTAAEQTVPLDLSVVKNIKGKKGATLTLLSGPDPKASNTRENPSSVLPSTTEFILPSLRSAFSYAMPPYSLSVLRIPLKK